MPGKRNLSPKPGSEGSAARDLRPAAGQRATPTSQSRPDSRDQTLPATALLCTALALHAGQGSEYLRAGPPGREGSSPREAGNKRFYGDGPGAGLQVPPRKSRALVAGSRVCYREFPGPPRRFLGAGGGRAGAAGVAGPAGSSHSSPSRSTPRTCRDGAGGLWQLTGVGRQRGKLKTPHKTRLFFFPGKWVMEEGVGQVAALPFGFFFFSF